MDCYLLRIYWFTRLLLQLPAKNSNRLAVDQKREDLAAGENRRDEHVQAVAQLVRRVHVQHHVQKLRYAEAIQQKNHEHHVQSVKQLSVGCPTRRWHPASAND